MLYVHPALIEQALVNVLENAARFSPPQGCITIEAYCSKLTRATKNGTTKQDTDEIAALLFSVTDEGPGIPPELREQVFDMFVTGHEGDRNRHGSGLGLAISRGMFGAHAGHIYAKQGPAGIGTTIAMALPLPSEETECEQ